MALRASLEVVVRVVVLCLLVAVTTCTDGPAESNYLSAATEAGRWLVALEDPLRGIPDRAGASEPGSPGLGEGAAGRALFLAELFVASGDSAFLRLAGREIGRALASAGRLGTHGLYRGTTGIGAVALELSAVLPGMDLEADARGIFLEVAEEAIDRSGAGWGGVNDVLVGAAGIGLTLLRAHEHLEEPRLLRAAIETGDILLREGRAEDGRGTRWFRGTEAPVDLPNFSHGTAGVGFFLASLGGRTGEDRFLEAAHRAAQYIESIRAGEGDLFLVPYGVPNESYATPYDIGWAHGPAGTGLLFYELWKTRVRDDPSGVDGAATTILASGVPGASQDTSVWRGPFRLDRRFGTAGSAMFLFDWGQERGEGEYLARAFDIIEDLEGKATVEDGLRWWTVPLYGFQGEGEAEFTGHFYGAAGFGSALLRAHYASIGEAPRFRLPDDPFDQE